MENLIFLDYDGVVNIPMFVEGRETPRFYFPSDNMVNNYQACRWLSLLCLETDSSIVVTSEWRRWDNYKECLKNGGLLPEVNIIGNTPIFYCDNLTRGKEIRKWMNETSISYDKFIIIDDDDDMEYEDLRSRLIRCDTMIGFTYYEYRKAKEMLMQ